MLLNLVGELPAACTLRVKRISAGGARRISTRPSAGFLDLTA